MSDDVILSAPVEGSNLATLKSTCTKTKGDIAWYPRSTVSVRQRREEPSYNSVQINRVHKLCEAKKKMMQGGRRGERREKEGQRRERRKKDRGRRDRDLNFSFDGQERVCRLLLVLCHHRRSAAV